MDGEDGCGASGNINGVLNFYFHLIKVLQYTPTVDIINGCDELLKL